MPGLGTGVLAWGVPSGREPHQAGGTLQRRLISRQGPELTWPQLSAWGLEAPLYCFLHLFYKYMLALVLGNSKIIK